MDIKKKSTGSASTTKSGNKSGRGRKTKSKEEEEKRQEEEARLRMEQEEKEKKEREKQLEQERKGRQEKVNEIKHRELNSFYDLMSEINMKLESYHKNRREKSKYSPISKLGMEQEEKEKKEREKQLEEERKGRLIWERYMRCDGSPDPTIPGEINTFLTLWKEDDLSEDFKTSLDNLNLAFRLIDELKFLIEDMTENEQTEKLIERYQNSIRDLEEVTKFKLDQTSHSILLNASNETDPETLNFNFADGNKEIYFCIWANLSHNKRINGFSFTTKDFSFRLPKPLTLAHFNLRCLFTTYDFYTPKSRTYLCRIKDDKFDFDPIPEIKIEKQKEKSDAEDQVDTLPPELKFLMEKTDLSENEDEEKNEQSVNQPITKVEEEETKQVQEPKKSISQDELAILQELSDSFVIDLRNFLPLGPVLHIGLYDIPPQPKKVKQLILTQRDPNETLIPFVYPSLDTNLPTAAWQEFWSKKQENDNLSSTNHAEPNDLGDTISSKKNDLNSTVKSNDLLESTVAGADETLTSDKNFLKSLSTKSNEQLINSMKNEGTLDIKYKLPSTLFFGEAPLLARWDEQKNHWRTDEILDFKYDDDQRAISFKTYHFSPYCLLQDRHVHMPFQLWRMAPREAMDSCMFTIETTNFELNIEIKSDKLRLYVPIRKPSDEELNKDAKKSKQSLTNKPAKPEKLQHIDYEIQNPNLTFMKVIEPIANQWFDLRDFKRVLKSIGLNIFPEPDSEKFVTITSKDKKLEWLTYRNMALCSCLISFAYSKWNAEIDVDDKIVMLYQTHTTDKEPNPDLYKCLISTTDVFYVIESNENSDELEQIPAPGTEEHSNMYHLCMEDLCKNDTDLVNNRIKEIDPLYYETCLKFLESVKILTFS